MDIHLAVARLLCLCTFLQRSAFCVFAYLLVILPATVGLLLTVLTDVYSCWQVAPVSLAPWTRDWSIYVLSNL